LASLLKVKLKDVLADFVPVSCEDFEALFERRGLTVEKLLAWDGFQIMDRFADLVLETDRSLQSM